MTDKIHDGHRSRMKKRFIQEGLDSFKDYQALELLLFYAIPMRDTNELAHKLINEFGSLHGLLEADPMDICARCQVSEHTAVLITMIPQLSRKYLNEKWGEKPVINSSARAGEYAVSLFIGRTYEVFYVLCLDSQNKVNYSALVHEGTINEAPVYPRLIVETALRHQANSVILAHNHPGGSLKPSSADLDVTRKIINALGAISIKVVDHIIVAGERYFSLAEKGLM